MSDINKNAVLAEVLSEHHELIPIIHRFGIRLGVGDQTISQLCEKNNLNIDFILTVLNVYLDETYFPKKKLAGFDIQLIADYFKQTIENYMTASVPNIEKHLNAFVAISGSDSRELKMIHEIFLQFKVELTKHFEKGLNHIGDYPHELLHDLRNIFIKHISPQYNQNLCYAVIFSISSLENDLIIHNRLRNKILIPKLRELDSTGIHQLQSAISPEKKIHEEETHTLSKREREILQLIARGFLNKEIADKLHISLNTVLTHRKNIIAKIGIKTVSGLTIYCISKGLLSPDS